MNLPKSLLNIFASSLIVVGFHGSAIAFEENYFQDNLLAQNPNCDNPQTQAEMNWIRQQQPTTGCRGNN